MPYKDKEQQRQAQWKYTRKFDKYPIMIFNKIKGRLKHKESYQGRKLLIDKDTFVNWMINNPVYKPLYYFWKSVNFELKYAPSIDRIDNTGDYTLDNIQIITQSENSAKLHYEDQAAIIPDNSKKVKAVSIIHGVKEFDSIVQASILLDISEKGIRKILNQPNKSLHGYSFFTYE